VGFVDAASPLIWRQKRKGEFLLTPTATVATVARGAQTRANATNRGPVVLPDKPNMVEVADAECGRGGAVAAKPRSFYLSFATPTAQQSFVACVRHAIDRLAMEQASAAPIAEPAAGGAEDAALRCMPEMAATKSVPDTHIPTPTAPLGVHVSVLQQFARDHPGLTTTELCTTFVKPATLARQCAYIDLLVTDSDARTPTTNLPLVGPATCFVSHAWMCKYEDVLDCINQHNTKHPDTYFWFDLVTNNQHKATSFPFEWWCTTFKESIRGIGSVLLCMLPWDNPIPLTRAWCLFEMYSTIDVAAQMHVAIPASQRPAFKQAMGEDFDTITDVLVALDGEKASATNPADKEQIFAVVKTQIEGGFNTLNNTVKNHLREWYLQTCVALATDEQDATLLYNLGIALRQHGDHDRALDMLEESLHIKLATLGENDPSTAVSYNAIGGVYESEGDYDVALEYYHKDLSITLATLGETHPNTAASYYAIGVVHWNKGDYDEALEHLDKALSITLATLGENHPSTARTYNAIGNVYRSKDDNDKALDYLHKALTIFLATLGENHPSTAITYNAIGNVHESQDNHDKALEYYHKDLSITVAARGENHPKTAASYYAIGNVYLNKGDSDKALEYDHKALAIQLAALGENHPDTAITYNAIGNVYQSEDDYEKALDYYDQALAIQLATLGENHPDTAITYTNVALVYKRQGDAVHAQEMYGRALAIFEATLGRDHPHTETCQSNLDRLSS
jgi:tetratricopeptide (TPR) repeat protein